jgi:hypothetical protein
MRPARSLFVWWWGNPPCDALGRELIVAFGYRRDLMTRPDDWGRLPLVAFEFSAAGMRGYTAIQDKAPWWRGWHFRVRWRSDAREILQLQPGDA